MQADSIAKDTSTLPQTAAPVDFSTAKTVIRHHFARKWSRMAKPAVPHATYVNRDQEKHFTSSQRTLLSHLHTGGHTPELAWYRNRITRNQDQPEPVTCQWCGQAEEMLVHLMTIGTCTQPPFRWEWSLHLSVQWTQSSTQLPEGCWPRYEAGCVWSLIERQKKTTTVTATVNIQITVQIK